LELPDAYDAGAISFAAGDIAYDRPIIALAVFPAVPEALPRIHDAFAGAGRPAGILACHRCPGGVIVEWDPRVTRADVVLGLVDVELRRFASGRTAELLSPLPDSLVAQVAAEGLDAPQIEPNRILELGIERA
jgi:hypothetical protein